MHVSPLLGSIYMILIGKFSLLEAKGNCRKLRERERGLCSLNAHNIKKRREERRLYKPQQEVNSNV